MTITEALAAEHTVFLRVFDQVERVLPRLATPGEVKAMASLVEGLLKSHADAEANLAYLALDHVLENKGQLEQMHQDHHEIDSRLGKVHLASTCAEARRLLGGALKASREHFDFEEKSVFPLLESTLEHQTLEDLGHAWRKHNADEKTVPCPA